MEHCIVISTCPDMDSAESLVASLLEQRLAACVNILPGIQSRYEWKGELVKDQEVLLYMKSRMDHFEAIEDLIKRQHPYELPEIIAVPISKGLAPYLSWIDQQVE